MDDPNCFDSGLQIVCAIPQEFCAVILLEVVSGNLLAHTESGHVITIPPETINSRPN